MSYFLKTIARFTVATMVFVGIPELVLHHMVSTDSGVANRHYELDEATGVWTFVPVAGCRLPPSQPYALQLALNALKVIGIIAILGPTADLHTEEQRNEKVEGVKLLAHRVLMAYQLVMIPVTMVATVGHFFLSMGPFDSYWHGYMCFGVLWTLGPWWFNGLFFIVKQFLHRRAVNKMTPRNLLPKARISFLGGEMVSIYDLEHAKEMVFELGAACTIIPYVLVWAPFCITHLLPAALLFLPQVLVVCGIMGMVFYATSVDHEGRGIARALLPDIRIMTPQYQIDATFDAERSGGLPYLPLLICINVLAEVLVLQAIYLYSGDGYLATMKEAWLERRTEVYFVSFQQKVLGMFYATSDLLIEIF